MRTLDPAALSEILQSKRFLTLNLAAADPVEIATWDDLLLRDPRLLVPIDVQALYVPAGSKETMLRLPLMLAGDGVQDPTDGMPAPFAPGTPRPGGVHLHWAMPDALLRGRLEEREAASANRLGLPALPDRWVVLRIVLPTGATVPAVRGWVLEADRAIAVDLEVWTEDAPEAQSAQPAGVALAPAELTGTVGGSLAWSGIYDAVLNRFAFHDPLDDLATLAPDGVDADCAAYVVAGWWSDPAADALDAGRTSSSFAELLDGLRWRALSDWSGERSAQLERLSRAGVRAATGLDTGERFAAARTAAPPAAAPPAAAPPARAAAFAPIDKTVAQSASVTGVSKFATDVVDRFVTEPWHPRSSLLHGAVYGVPVTGPVPADQRPPPEALRVALGRHDDDVIAALATAAHTPAEERADTERLLGAFTAQKLRSFASPEGAVDVEEYVHSGGFGAIPAGTATTDRYLSGGREGTRFAGRRGRRSTQVQGGVAEAGRTLEASLRFSEARPGDLLVADAQDVNDALHSVAPDAIPATEPRIVARPAPRYRFPLDPLVAVQGARRSLRHGGDGRASADGRLRCRWPSQVISEVTGVLSGETLIRSLGNGAIPEEVLMLAREAVLHDPYHVAWLATAASPGGAPVVVRRLAAEAALRFGADGRYDGATDAFGAASGFERRAVADELRRFSLLKGADPDPVGVTAWSLPWVPLWLEWEIEVSAPASPSLDGWSLGAVDLEREAGTGTGAPPRRTVAGRAALTTGAATTLGSAVTDWLAAEDARDATGVGEADEATEAALAQLAGSVRDLDIVTATVDGLRRQLLGLPAGDDVRRRDGDAIVPPAPLGPPALLVAGHVRLSRARLLDAFGRVLDVPVDAIRTPVTTGVDGVPGALEHRPRLMRPARWRYTLVDAAAPAGAPDAAEARVDQVDPTLAVNPVAGFLLPDHLDESLEVFGVDGAPLGELLHEAVGDGVVWEIAAGREGPPDAGPAYGLAPAQQALGMLASGLVAADATHRRGEPALQESALSALLRAIDTTLWTVDAFALLGGEHVAGLVGRPIAVVRAQLRLELLAEDDLDLSDPERAAERVAAEQALAAVPVPVRIGELTRTDDGVLAFFVDDDYSRVRLVDRTVAALAVPGGRSRGQLGLLGGSDPLPAAEPIVHPYVIGDGSGDTLALHLGQTVTLTLLMHPGGKAHLSSGVLPRKALSLARDWVAPGLAALAPSLRTGPVVVETDLAAEGQVRLPTVSVFGADQAFLWRDTPATWRTDAILAATQSALLPDTPAAVREGWVRAVPIPPGGQA